MKKINWFLALIAAAISPSAFAAYTPYFTDPLTSFQSAYWNGSLTFYGGGYTYGTMFSKVAVPDGTNSYDIKETINSSGTYILLLRVTGSPDPFSVGWTACTGVEAYYAVQFATSGTNLSDVSPVFRANRSTI